MLFIDYDNLLGSHKQAGVLDVVTSALLMEPLRTSHSVGHCDVRVYGGWYEGSKLTPLAQQVSVQLQSIFPAIIRCPTTLDQICALSAEAEMAYALSEEPGHHLLDTFRRKRVPTNIKCVEPTTAGCQESSCSLAFLPVFLVSGKCPNATCNISIEDLLFRNEQKLVDTMLTCDIIYSTRQNCDLIIAVSGDDDLLPAVRTALLNGTPVRRIRPKAYLQPTVFPSGGALFSEHVL